MAKSSADRRAEYNAYQFLRERGRLPFRVRNEPKVRRRGNSEIEQDLKGKPITPESTTEEDLLAEMFAWRGIRFERQFCIKIARKKQKGRPMFAFVDFWLPDAGLVVEVDGYHHRRREQKRLDKIRSVLIQNAMPSVRGVFRIWNGEVRNRAASFHELIQRATSARP